MTPFDGHVPPQLIKPLWVPGLICLLSFPAQQVRSCEEEMRRQEAHSHWGPERRMAGLQEVTQLLKNSDRRLVYLSALGRLLVA